MKHTHLLNYQYPPQSLSDGFFIYPPGFYWLTSPILKLLSYFNLESIKVIRILVNLPSLMVLLGLTYTTLRNSLNILNSFLLTVQFLVFICTLDFLSPWITLLRQDLLVVVILALCIYLMNSNIRKTSSYILIGVLFSIPFLLKQSYLLILGPLLLSSLLNDRRYFFSLLTSVTICLTYFLTTLFIYGKGYYTWAWVIPSEQRIMFDYTSVFLEYLKNFSSLFLFFIIQPIIPIFRNLTNADNIKDVSLLSLILLILLISTLSAFKSGGYIMSFIPGLILLTFYFITINKIKILFIVFPILIILNINTSHYRYNLKKYSITYKSYINTLKKVSDTGSLYTPTLTHLNKNQIILNEVVLKYEITIGNKNRSTDSFIHALNLQLKNFGFIALKAWPNTLMQDDLNRDSNLEVNLLTPPKGYVKAFSFKVMHIPNVTDAGFGGGFFPSEIWARNKQVAQKLIASLNKVEKAKLNLYLKQKTNDANRNKFQ